MGHIPRKRFGQHFLHDNNIIQHIVATLAPVLGQHLVEIGPGQGALTIPVLAKVQQLEVVELDRDLAAQLVERNRTQHELIVHQADALTFDFASLQNDARLLRVFGNLPYNISTPLIFHLLDFVPHIADMLFMLQKEVAERMAAAAGSDAYGRLSVMVQYHCRVELMFDVPPSAFYPPPAVQSSIVRLVPHGALPHHADDFSLFASIVKQAFGQRRKTLRNSLKAMVDDTVWAEMPAYPQLRAEDLTVADFVKISNLVKRYGR